MENILTMLKSSRVLFWTGLLLLASGLFHVGVWTVAGMPSLDGPVSWRKPITFGLSTGVLFLSLAWVLSLMPETNRRSRQSLLFSLLLLAEVALIDMQQWRGVASHFNTTTPFDAAVFRAMGALIISASVIIILWTRDLFRTPLATSPASAFAARAGMLLLNVGNLIGLVMATTQMSQFKPVHGLTLHAIQALPIAVWALARLFRTARRFGYARAWRDDSRASYWLSSPGWHRR